MAPLSLKVVLDEGAVTRTVLFEASMTVEQALAIVKEKMLTGGDGKEYGLFLTSADDERSGIWLERHRNLEYYMLRDGDHLHYLCRIRNVRIRMLDGSVKTLPVDESKTIEQLMVGICARIGIMNHEEYGLCHDEEETIEEKLAPGTGTLTLKRMTQPKERDAKLEQLSKKLKTDDNVEWLDQHKTFREMGVGPKQTLLLKRRLFYTDCNVDARDPVGLNLLYVQTRDAVLEGHHPVTEDQALQFAGIQCQIQYGDFHEDKHKPGLIDVSEFLPKERTSSRGMESKILKEHRKHQGLSEVDAKLLYIKTARDLPTFGVTFFLVKEKQKGKKKLVPRLLGINKESILRLDENTKEILQVWPLTQVKTYHAGKSETFTLNFGDYSDKEYSVKTNDAHRIRDILQSYIDIIKRRMDAAHRLHATEHHAIVEDHVEASRGHLMERIEHNPSKILQETFVGPSKIVSYEPGQQISQGTQIVTVQQIVVTNKGSNQQTVMMGQVPARKDMPMEFVRKLNRLNSNSVKIVTFLTEPTDSNVLEAQKLVESMNADMPSIEEGVNAAAQQQSNDDAKKKLLDELRELRDCMKALTDATVTNVNPEQGQEAARNVADLSTQMYFSVDPRTVKRGALCRRSRNSFIQDEKVDATLRRASFIAAAQTACGSIDDAKSALDQDYQGPILDAADVEELEKAAEDKIGKLSAAVALYLTANADPKNIDYGAAVNSMNTINELLPELTRDAAVLSGVKDGKSRQEFLDEMRALCDAAKRVCLINKPEDHEKLQEAAADYGRISEKLLFTFKRMKGRGDEVDKHNELIDLAKDVGNKTSLLLMKANELTSLVPTDPRAADVDDAGVSCADAAKDLLTCATLTASSIHEPHCQSALTAAAETLSSRAQQLAAAWKPLVEDPSRKDLGEHLKDRSFDLAKALDRLKDAFASLNGLDNDDGGDDKVKEGRRLKFIATVGAAKKGLDDADTELKKVYMGPAVDKATSEELQRKLAQRVAQLNAALAALVAAVADRDKPDFATADLAVATITELMPEIVKDGKVLGAWQHDASRAAMLADLQALCDAARHVCAASEHGDTEGLNNAAAKLSNSSGKLFYVFNPRANRDKEQAVTSLSSSAQGTAASLAAAAEQLAAVATDPALSEQAARVKAAAGALHSTAQLTAPCISDPRCQATLASSVDTLASANQALTAAWTPVVQDPRFQQFGQRLERDRRALQDQLDRLKSACLVAPLEGTPDDAQTKEGRRLKFINTVGNAKKKLNEAEAELKKSLTTTPVKGASADELQKKMAQRIAELNAALADLVAATADRSKPDYKAADEAVAKITELMPVIVKDGKALSGGQDEATRAAMLADLKALCDAARDVCASSEHGDTERLNTSATKLAKSAGKLFYVFNPRGNQNKEHEIVELSSTACGQASAMLARARQLPAGAALAAASARVAGAADALRASAQLTAPCMSEPRCQAALTSSVDALADATEALASAWEPVVRDPRFQPLGKSLDQDRSQLLDALERLKKACRVPASDGATGAGNDGVREQQRLRFVSSATNALARLDAAERDLDKPAVAPKGGKGEAAEELQRRLARALAELNAAVAVLVAATSDRDRPDYVAANQSIDTLNQLIPQVVKDAKAASAGWAAGERGTTLADVRALCQAARDMCAGAGRPSAEELNSAAGKFAGASGKLVYVFDLRATQDKEHEILDISSAACEKASRLLNGVYEMAAAADARAAEQLDAAGSRVADAANALLTTAQLTAPSLHDEHCQASLLASADTLAAATQSLASTWAPVVRDPRFLDHGDRLENDRLELQRELDRLKKACHVGATVGMQVKHLDPVQERQRLQFVSVAAQADKNLRHIQKELDKPLVACKPDQSPGALHGKLAHSLALLNAAIAGLLVATSDRDKPNYDEAEQAIQVINQLMPQVIKDTRSLSACKEEPERTEMLDQLRAACVATSDLCARLRDGDTQEATKLAAKAAKLMFVINPQDKHQKILEASAAAGRKAAQLVTHARSADASDASLMRNAAGTAHAADTLLATAQLTAPCISEPQSQAALLSATDALQQSGRSLAELAGRCHSADRTQLDIDLKELTDALGNLKELISEESNMKSPLRRAPPPPPKRTVSMSNEVVSQLLAAGADSGYVPGSTRDFNQEFLERLRHEENQNTEDTRNKRKMDDEKALQKHFMSVVDAAAQKVRKAEEDVKKIYNTTNDEVIPTLSVDQTLVVQKQMEQKLAAAAVAVSDLVASNHPDSIDLVVASKATTNLSDVLPHIVQDSKLLRGSLDENERKAFLADILALFDATKKLCESAKDDRKMLDKSAVEFANKSTKLLYVVSTDADPSQEKEVVQRVRSVNEAASRLALAGGDAAAALPPQQAHALCLAGGRCAHAATALAYTAKLVAPSIQNVDSHEALSKATSNLTDTLQAYSSTWKPLEASQPSTVEQLRAEAASLQKLLEELRKDLESGNLVKRRTVERVVVEDTPLRQLASVVLEEAKRKAESTTIPGDLRAKYAKYANDLGRSIRDLDLANHRCRHAPHDTEKWQELEYAVQNLQVSLLQGRPSEDGRPQDNIVDLTNYVKDIATAADNLKKLCKPGQAEVEMVRAHCEHVSAQASRVMTPSEPVDAADDAFADIQEVDHFAEECDTRCKTINAIIDALQDGKLKIELHEKAMRLSEDCNMLRFATKSALAASRGVSLDATLHDLTTLEPVIDEMLVPGEKISVPTKGQSSGGVGRRRLVAAATRAGSGVGSDLPPAFTAYLHDMRTATAPDSQKQMDQSKEHLKKVLHSLKTLTMTTSRHVATWQRFGHPETAEITTQIIEELDRHENSLNAAAGKSQRSALAEVDINRLLVSSEVPVKGIQTPVSAERLQQAAARLWLAACGAAQGAGNHTALARSAAATVEAAQHLTAHAQLLPNKDLTHRQKIDEASKEVSLQTYNLLKAADVVSQDSRNYAARKRLLDACRCLNDAINKLVRSSGAVSRLQCGELTRQLQLQQARPPRLPASAAPYHECADALHGQADVLHKLNNDQPMSREEFSRTLSYVNAAVCNSTEYAAQCAYLLSIADQNKDIALEGFVDTSRIINLSETVQETCHRIIGIDVEQAIAEEVTLSKQIQDLQQALSEAGQKTRDSELREQLAAAGPRIDDAARGLSAVLHKNAPSRVNITSRTVWLVDAVRSAAALAEAGSLAPEPTDAAPATNAKCDDILKNSRNLSNNMMSLLREVRAAEDTDPMTWVTFGSRKSVLEAFEALLNSVKQNGKQSGVLEPSQSDLEEDGPRKSYLQVQLDLAYKWLKRPTAKSDVKAAGENAAKNIIQLGQKLSEDMKGVEQEEMTQLVAECKDLVADCCQKYDQEKASVLMERLRELKKGIERGVVTRVVEDFLEGEEPLADLDIIADVEKDESKRQLILERKIAELLAQLARVTKTARMVAAARAGAPAGAGAEAAAAAGEKHPLVVQSETASLLAPALVQAAQRRVADPADQAAIEHYQKLLAEYAESLANVRSLCDQAVDPMDFVQTAGETMQRMREETNHNNDPQKCAYASMAITKLANRVIAVSMSSIDVRKDPELQKALTEAKERLRATVPPPNARTSRIPDWKVTTAEILRTTGEVESVLGGEMIFKKQQGTDQPIFAAAFGLHAAVREWSARDNEIVAVARRMAVLMAKLSDYMNTDRKRELLATSKAIVSESHEVARLAKKLAHECTDVRIKTNLLQVCERIPTISGQLKMLATVKGSSLGHQGFKEDQEDMIMLVGNAQNLMTSVQEVVKAAASATVKIASQRGGTRMRWVRNTYY